MDGEFEMIPFSRRGEFISRKSRDSPTRFYAFSRVEINIFFFFSDMGSASHFLRS